VSLFSQPTKSMNLDKYIDEMQFCYDQDGDGKLDTIEMKNMVSGQLGENNCAAPFKKLQSNIIVDEK
jgi:Ca2+-binding EF-hand superfamily protein